MSYCINGCESPYLQFGHQCLASCPSGYATKSTECVICDEGADNCIWEANSQKTRALSCLTGYYLYSGSCFTVCPIGMYPDTSKNTCEFCNIACYSCFGNSEKNCIECNKAQGYLMSGVNYCSIPSCIEGMFYNLKLLSCVSCPLGCLSCTSSAFCTICNPGYEMSKSHICTNICDKDGFRQKANSIDCEEICGDGKNMHMLPCDDGNTNSGDGCDSNCQIEEFFECTGGNEYQPDKCRKTLKPIVESFVYYGNRTAVVKFSEKVHLNNSIYLND